MSTYDAATEHARSYVDPTLYDTGTIEEALFTVLGDLKRPWQYGLDINVVTSKVGAVLLGYTPMYWPGAELEAMLLKMLNRLARAGSVAKIKRGAQYMTFDGPKRNGGQYTLWVRQDTFDQWQVDGAALVAKRERSQAALEERVAKLRDWADVQGVEVQFDEHGRAIMSPSAFESVLLRLAD